MNKKRIIGTTSIGILSSLLAFLGVVSCCGLPIIAGVLAWLGIGASQLRFFSEYRPIFIGVAIIALIFGFWQAYFKKKPSCCTSVSCCGATDKQEETTKQKSNIFQQVVLWIGAIVIVLMLILGEQNSSTEQSNDLFTPQIQMQGISSSCCPAKPTKETVQEKNNQSSGCCLQN